MGGVFVNYRIKDEPLGAASIYRELTGRFGVDQVFRDTDSLRPGDHYPDEIRRALRESDIVLALVGPDWLTLRDSDGTRLIDRERDWVRTEIEDAFEHDIPVLPVLLLDTPQPDKKDLPASIGRLAVIQSMRIGFSDFDESLEKLARELTHRVPHLAVPQLFDTAATQPVTWLPSGLLRPEYRLVPSDGRAVERGRLRAWAESPGSLSAQLLLSAPGDGKTRMARDLVEDMRAAGWVAGLVRDTVPPAATAGMARIRKPLLLVVDDAERRVDQVKALSRALLDQSAARSMPVRLLLTSTHADWLPLLCTDDDKPVADLYRRCAEQRLAPLPAQLRPAEFVRAGQAFASALRFPSFAEEAPETVEGSSYVEIHAAALAVLLGGDGRAAALAELYRHDQRFWSSGGHGLDPARLSVAVAAATIFGAATERSARELLAALPGFTDLDEDALGRYVSWLSETYPGDGALNPIYPRLLAGEHVLAVLDEHPDLVTAVAGVLGDRQVEQALVTLTLASSPRHDLTEVLAEFLKQDAGRFLPTAVRLVGQLANPQPLVAAMKLVLGTDVPPHTLVGMFEGLGSAGPGAMPLMHQLSQAMVDKIAPPSEQDPAMAKVTEPLQNMVQNLMDGLLGPLTGQANPNGTPGPFNQDTVDMLRTLMQLRRKYPD
ncbi:MAG: toll/interleukin-1 receptor domain-containing protein [Actinophytocola sp.]|uniref:toll/interleukin-1 receptor domain-containing protein n=1 Tax=Actinophytocola sp. TaxID=1872138 RepID=UPI003C723877